jgi:hypothetical protein
MSKLDQMRHGMEQLIDFDKDVGVITREKKTDNGRGQLIPTGEKSSHEIICRVGYKSEGVWASKHWEGGLTTDGGSNVLARYDVNIEQDDELEWRGKKFIVGVVARQTFEGAAVCTLAPLIEISNG